MRLRVMQWKGMKRLNKDMRICIRVYVDNIFSHTVKMAVINLCNYETSKNALTHNIESINCTNYIPVMLWNTCLVNLLVHDFFSKITLCNILILKSLRNCIFCLGNICDWLWLKRYNYISISNFIWYLCKVSCLW